MIPCAIAQNIQTMLIARFLDGLAGSAFLSVAGGTVGDMFAKHVCQHHLQNNYTHTKIDPEIGAFSTDDGVHSESFCRPRIRPTDRRCTFCPRSPSVNFVIQSTDLVSAILVHC
jgi:hypothetical protein